MKTVIVLSDYGAARHIGEEYDSIVYVCDAPDTSNINGEALRIKNEIESFGKEEEVLVFCDATPVYFTVVENIVFRCVEEGYNSKITWKTEESKNA